MTNPIREVQVVMVANHIVTGPDGHLHWPDFPPDLYKVLGPKAQAINGGKATWHKPHGKRPGKWMPAVKKPLCCLRGYHLVELSALPQWLAADCTIYLAEGRGASHTDGDGKTAFAQARLLKRLHLSEQDMRLFAADCAEHVLPIWEKSYPNDDRPAKAIEAARRFAHGEIDAAEAARAADAAEAARAANAARAAWAANAAEAAEAAWVADAAWAARAAAWAAGAARAAEAANAAEAAEAAWVADAARAAERQWQGETLRRYFTDG